MTGDLAQKLATALHAAGWDAVITGRFRPSWEGGPQPDYTGGPQPDYTVTVDYTELSKSRVAGTSIDFLIEPEGEIVFSTGGVGPLRG